MKMFVLQSLLPFFNCIQFFASCDCHLRILSTLCIIDCFNIIDQFIYVNRIFFSTDDRRENRGGFGFDRRDRDEHDFDRSQLRSNEDSDRDRKEAYNQRSGGGYDRDGYDRDRRDGYDRRRDGYDRDRRDGYDRDRRDGYDRDRRDGYDRRGGGYDRRDGYDRDRYDRRDRDGYDQRDRYGGGRNDRYDRAPGMLTADYQIEILALLEE